MMASSVSSASLKEDAEYGKLDFDQFALANWDYSRSVSEDKQQWEELVPQFLALTPLQRLPYRVLASSYPTPAATPDRVARVLAPHQTTWERNLAASNSGSYSPVLLRTCYAPELEEAYRLLAEQCEIGRGFGVEPDMVLDNPARYNFGSHRDAWKNILICIPTLPDTLCGSVEEDFEWYGAVLEEGRGVDVEDDSAWLEHASDLFTMLVYVVDDEAVREGLVKMKWLDAHGRCIWENRIPPNRLAPFRGGLMGGTSPGEAVETFSRGENAGARNAVLRP